MKKKFLVGSLLPVLAGAAVVGSGFSLWFFNETEEHAGQTVSANVTQLVKVGSVEAASEFTIVFDQTAEGRGDKALNGIPAAKGIYLDWGTDEASAKKQAVYTSPDSDSGAIDSDDNVHVKFVTVIKASDVKILEYVKLTYESSTVDEYKVVENAVDGTYTITQYFEHDTAAGSKVFDWGTTAKFDYKNGKEPSTSESYKNFYKLVHNATFTVTYTATVVSK